MKTMQKSTFAAAKNNTVYFWEIRVDVPNRRVITRGGRAGTIGKRTSRRFVCNDDVRNFADAKIDQKINSGFEQVA